MPPSAPTKLPSVERIELSIFNNYQAALAQMTDDATKLLGAKGVRETMVPFLKKALVAAMGAGITTALARGTTVVRLELNLGKLSKDYWAQTPDRFRAAVPEQRVLVAMALVCREAGLEANLERGDLVFEMDVKHFTPEEEVVDPPAPNPAPDAVPANGSTGLVLADALDEDPPAADQPSA